MFESKPCFSAGNARYRWTAAAASLFLACVVGSPLAASAQQDVAISSPKGITPQEVTSGKAQLVGSLAPTQKLRLVIALRPPHLAEERQFVEALRTKGSPQFGKFLSPEQWNARFSPSAADEQQVVEWAQAQGLTVTDRYPNRLIVEVVAPAATIEKAFNVKLNQYLLNGNLKFSSDRDPELPANIAAIVQNVQGLNNMRVLHPVHKNLPEPAFPIYTEKQSANTASNPLVGAGTRGSASGKGVSPNITGGAYDPSDIYSSQAYDVSALYNQGHCCNPLGNPTHSPKETSIAIATAGTQDPNDLVDFYQDYGLAYYVQPVPLGSSWPCDSLSTSCDGEGTMDAEWSVAMSNSFAAAGNTAEVYLYDATDSGFGTFESMYERILSDNATRVMTTSWGCEEIACYDTTDMESTDNIFLNMVGEGWTLVAASGDQGATAGCGDGLAVQYPSSDPNVVGAGGTTLYLSSGSQFEAQVAWSGGPDGCGANDGGSTGGFSAYWSTPGYQSGLDLPSRGVPDLALNADWYNTPQNMVYARTLQGNGGTSIVAPELAGIFAQFNAYLLTLGNNCQNEGGPCAPMGGLVNSMIYWLGENPNYAPHYPFYDITSGCNDNNITAYYGLGYYCAGTGYDEVTGWGSFNALQLAWGINTFRAGDFGDPVVSFSGPSTSKWYNTNQTVAWSVTDTSGLSGYSPNGVAGFTQGWDSIPSDAHSEATPGSGNSFYSGPEYPNATTGCLQLTSGGGCAGGVSQGCHYAHVQAWDNSGFSSGNVTYGPVCYDTTAPVTTAASSGTQGTGHYNGPVKVTLSATDNLSGVAATYYQVNGGPLTTYTGPFFVTATGRDDVSYHSVDRAGNVEGTKNLYFSDDATTTTTLYTGANPITQGQSVVFTVVVAGSVGTPTGNVELKDGSTVLQTLALSSGKAHFTVSNFAPGTHAITAVYEGSSTDVGSTSNGISEVVKAKTTTALYTGANPIKQGQSVVFTVVVSASSGTPSGSVQLKDGSTVLQTQSLSSGKIHFTVSSLSKGTHSISAVYEGTSTDAGSTSNTISETVD